MLVFPSWEKFLENNDEQTQRGISALVGDFFAHFLGASLSSMEEVGDFAQKKPNEFIGAVAHHHLFVAPGGDIDATFEESLARYEEEIRTWRTPAWLERFATFPVHFKVLNAIIERLGAQYHLLENSEELGSHPLLPLPQQSHYFKLVSETNSARLAHLGLLDEKQKALIDGISAHRLKWLSNVPIGALVELRQENENVSFRKRLEGVIRQMHDSKVGDASNVAAEVAQEIASAMADHDRAMREVQKKFNRTHGATAAAAWTAFGAVLMPSLAPFLGLAAPIGLAAKYVWDKFDERAAKASLARSFMGIIATAHDSDKNNS